MNNASNKNESTTNETGSQPITMGLELIVIPVSDVDLAKHFYLALGWRLDLDFKGDDGYRVIQVTPPGSGCSVIFGKNVTTAAPGSAQGLYLIVSNIKAVREELIRRGVKVDEPFHDTGGVFHHADGKGVDKGLHPQRLSYATFASFRDPDGNGWLLQEITARLSGSLKQDDPRFTHQILDALHAGQLA